MKKIGSTFWDDIWVSGSSFTCLKSHQTRLIYPCSKIKVLRQAQRQQMTWKLAEKNKIEKEKQEKQLIGEKKGKK